MKKSLLIVGILFSHTVHAFTLLTWNVAEYSDHNPERLQRLLSFIRERSPEVVLLQEVEKQTLVLLEKSSSRFTGYRILQRQDFSGLPEGGLVALVKNDWSLMDSRYERFPSDMDRGELIFTLNNVCGIPHTFITVHLESLDPLFWRGRAFRDQQVQKLKTQSERESGWVLAGDLNLVLKWDADQFSQTTGLMPGFPYIRVSLASHGTQTTMTWPIGEEDSSCLDIGLIASFSNPSNSLRSRSNVSGSV